MDYITLSNGIKMPQLGYGVYQVTIAKGAVGAVVFALVVAVPTAFGIISKNEGVA